MSNFLLMASFLGMGLGVAIGRRMPRLFHFTLPSLAALSALLAYSRPLGFLRIAFPDPTMALWRAELLGAGEKWLTNLGTIIGLFLLVTWVFLCAGTVVGPLFDSLRPLR